jgi:simple sugar transport system substrate-binding protein
MDSDPARRDFFSIPLLAAGALGVLEGCGQQTAKGSQSFALGPARTVIWAVGTTGSDFVTDISLGVADAAKMLGWRFSNILNTSATPDAHVNAIRQAVVARADVVITVDWYQAVVDEVANGQKSGTRFAIVNSLNNPDAMEALNVPFVGQQPFAIGREMGAYMAKTLVARGVRSGTVLAGNPFPGSANVEQRIAGIRAGLQDDAVHQSTRFDLVSFPDNAAQDAAGSVAVYKAKMLQTPDLVGHAVAGAEMSAIPLTTALAEVGANSGRYVVGGWTSSLKVLNLIKSRRMDFAVDESLYSQGMLATLLVWSMIERGTPSSRISSPYAIVTPANVGQMIASYEKRKLVARDYNLS